MTINLENESEKFGYPVHHKRKVPYIPGISIPHEDIRKNIEIFHLEAELDRFILSSEDYLELVAEAFSSNIHISTQLEGNPLTKVDVKRLTKGAFMSGSVATGNTFQTQEILNHLIAYMSPHFQTPWNLDHIKLIHEILMKGNPEYRPGQFRKSRAVVESSTGQELFIPAPPEYIEEELQALLKWLNTGGPGMYPVVSGALLFHEFESIHPFEDGNGRCGRSLFHIYLQRHGLPNSKLCFIEQNIVKDPERYYELLARTDFSQDYSALISHFMKSVHTSYSEAVERYREKDLLGSGLDETTKRILIKAKQFGNWFSLEYARHWFHQISDYVLRSRLNELVELGALLDSGSTRAKKYRFADPLVQFNEALHM